MTRAAGIAALKAKGLVPRGLTRAEAAAYIGVSTKNFSKRVREGRLPGASPVTGRWDRQAIDRALDGYASNDQTSDKRRSEIEAAIDAS